MSVPIVRFGTAEERLRNEFHPRLKVMYRRSLIVGILSLALAASGPSGRAEPLKANDHEASGKQAAKDPDISTPELADLAGERHRLLELQANRAAVVIFVLHDCPISNRYAPEIQRLADEFASKRVAFYLVHVDPQLSTADAKKHAKEYRYKLPVLVDRRHELVKLLKATTAPEAFVIGAEKKVLYRGRIDDRYAAVGKPRSQVQRQDLRLAVSAVVAGKRVEVAETKAIGCYIPELEE
jgi:thiol-disulfide isomerase/thioredoxin